MTDSTPQFATILMEREGRLLTVTLNRPEALNAFDKQMHDELPAALEFARSDTGSDVIVLTGAGKAFSAGGDFEHIAANAAEPERFDHEVEMAREIVMTMLDTDKPIVCRLNGHAVGLGATIALLCDIIYADERTKIGDPHVLIGLAAGDGGALVWPQRIGLARAKEYLMTGELLRAGEAAQIGLINKVFAPDELDDAVAALASKLLGVPQPALRATKKLTNLELKRLAETVLDQGLAWEKETVRSEEHRAALAAMMKKV